MKISVQKLREHSNYSKFIELGRLITVTGGAQLFVQASVLICGILIIRLMPTEEYALYTITNAMLGTLSVLSDGGISAGVMSSGGKVWKDKEKLGVVLVTGLALRRKFAIVSLLIAIPILSYLLLQHGAGILTVILIVIALIPAFFAALSDSLLEIIPKLHQDIVPLQKNQIFVSLSRTFLSALLLFFFPFAYLALVINGITRIYGNFKLRKIASGFSDFSQKHSPEVEKDILKIVKRILPTSIYFCFSGQITVWLISIFGSTNSIAEVGALTRLTMILSVFSAMSGSLLVPRFSRLVDNRRQLFLFFISVQGLVLGACVFLLLFTWLFSSQLLYIIGNRYTHLSSELILCMIGACFTFLGGVSFTLFSSRGWMINPILSIAIDVLVIIVGVMLFNISTLSGVLAFNIMTAAFLYISNTTYAIYKINKIK
ncbi:MATE family efflux transporter [Pedobacter sp. PWIIR3]